MTIEDNFSYLVGMMQNLNKSDKKIEEELAIFNQKTSRTKDQWYMVLKHHMKQYIIAFNSIIFSTAANSCSE